MTDDYIKLNCPHCDKGVLVRRRAKATRKKCPGCHERFELPSMEARETLPAEKVAEPETKLFIRQGDMIQGPYKRSKIQRYLDQGRLKPSMLMSRDETEWASPSEFGFVLSDHEIDDDDLEPPADEDDPGLKPLEESEETFQDDFEDDEEEEEEDEEPLTLQPIGEETADLDIGDSSVLETITCPACEEIVVAGDETCVECRCPMNDEEAQEAYLKTMWYVKTSKRVQGPWPTPRLERYIREGRVRMDMLVSRDKELWDTVAEQLRNDE